MRHWLQLATRNWRDRPGRAAAIALAVALGVATVVTVTSIYAAVERTIGEQVVDRWVGRTHLSVEAPRGHWGNVDAALAPLIAEIPGVSGVTTRFKTRMLVEPPAEVAAGLPLGEYVGSSGRIEIDVIGIDPAHEYDFRPYDDLVGRRIDVADTNVIILEERMARDLGLDIGDEVMLVDYFDGSTRPMRIIGLMPARRLVAFQKPQAYMKLADVQDFRREKGKVSVIDALVGSGEPQRIEQVAGQVRKLIRDRNQTYLVSTATTKINQLTAARKVTRLILMLFAFIALLTAFFIIITTMSMGMMERVRQLGLMRCVGVTRGQLAALVLVEIVPLGLFGVIAGVPLGLGLALLGRRLVPQMGDFVQDIVLDDWGATVAVIGGILTTLLGAVTVLSQGSNVSPMRALNSETRGSRLSVIIIAAAAGAVLLGVNSVMVRRIDSQAWLDPLVAFTGMTALYAGYMLIAPALVVAVGGAAVNLAAPLLGVRRRLAQDQVGRAPWRSAGVCWTLMVGLSLIVYFFVRGESITHAWDFPKRLAGTFVWAPEQFEKGKLAEVAALPAVGQITPILDVYCRIEPKRKTLISFFKPWSVFAAGEPETFFEMAKLEFLQGDPDEALAKLRRGGYVLLPPEAAHSFGYQIGDKVPVTVGEKTVEFEVAGVVKSPSMDIAVTYFQADSYMTLAAASSVLGTLDDVERNFGIDTLAMFLMNVELPPSEPPVEFAAKKPPAGDLVTAARLLLVALPRMPEQQGYVEPWREQLVNPSPARLAALSPPARGLVIASARSLATVARQWEERTPPERWEIYREQLVLERVKTTIDRPDALTGSLRQVKQDIDRDIRRATLIISSIPLLSLIVASLGVANLMTVNLAARARQIAILRAVGSTKAQITRLVLVEALVLGLLGSALGVLLGLHSAAATNTLTRTLIGWDIPWTVPWPRVLLAVGVTWLICLLAGIGPSLRAARSNIIDALQAT
jgi:putative ABC transport system permease protein